MCYDNVSRFALRPVEIRRVQPPLVNGQMDMLLLRRVKGTLTPTTAQPSSTSTTSKPPQPEPDIIQLRHILPEVQTEAATFSRLVADTREHQMATLSEEETALKAVADEMVACGEVSTTTHS